MFQLTVPWWELILRAGLIYCALLVLIRVTGKRQVGELSPFDLIFLLLISEQVSAALTGGDNSIVAALIGLGVLILLNLGVTLLTARSHAAEQALEGRPRFLIRNGKVDYARLRKESVSKNDLLSAMRSQGCFRPGEVDWAVLETKGTISVKGRSA